jgi:hypothetical protein
MFRTSIGVLLLLLTASSGMAQEQETSGVEKLGQVHFAASCNEVALGDFNHAVALLHSFQFSRAIESFNVVLREDPACAIAYWGIALSAWSNPLAPGQKDTSQLELGRQSVEHGNALGAKTERERAFLAAVGKLYSNYESTPQRARLVAYRDAMGEVAAKYPEDHESQIFYALALVVAADPADKTYADRFRAGQTLERMFAEEPTHPGLAHYIIHAYDVPGLCGRALLAARTYADIAPDAPHALHMPSHSFTRLGYWQESIDSNLAAAGAARRQHQTAEELHASDYETYAYLQTAQDEAAARVVNDLPEIAKRFDPKAVLIGAGPPAAGYFALAAIPARYALERQDWHQAERLNLRESPFPYADAMTWYARGMGAARLGHRVKAGEATSALKQIQDRLLKANEPYWAGEAEIQATAVAAWSALSAGKTAEAFRQMQSAVQLEDATEKSVLTPGPLFPARELLGEMYLRANQPAKALEQFEETLMKEPRRFRSLYGAAHAARLRGDRETSRRYFRELLNVCAKADKAGRPELREAREELSMRKI